MSNFLEGGEWDEEYRGIDSGWQTALAILKYYLEHYFGTPRQKALVIRPGDFSFERVAPYFREEAALARWLTHSGRIGERGEACNLVLKDGATVSGSVLSVTERQVAVGWKAERGVLELTAFALGPSVRAVCARVHAWTPGRDRIGGIEKYLEASADRLLAELTNVQA